jgi:hypothetical protein
MLSDHSPAQFSVGFPITIKPQSETLALYGLPPRHEIAFGVLVALLVSTGPSRPAAESEKLSLVRKLGRAFNEFGGEDEFEGLKYMRAAAGVADDLYGVDLSWLNTEWSGIGAWLG